MWTVQYRTRLQTDADMTAYWEFQSTLRNDTASYESSFRDRVVPVVADAATAAGVAGTADTGDEPPEPYASVLGDFRPPLTDGYDPANETHLVDDSVSMLGVVADHAR